LLLQTPFFLSATPQNKNVKTSTSSTLVLSIHFLPKLCSFSFFRTTDSTECNSHEVAKLGTRSAYALAVVESHAFFSSGKEESNIANDIIDLDCREKSTTQFKGSGSVPSARYYHSLVTFKDTLILFGGMGQTGELLNDLYSFTPCLLLFLFVYFFLILHISSLKRPKVGSESTRPTPTISLMHHLQCINMLLLF
jgi:hypothetical protein